MSAARSATTCSACRSATSTSPPASARRGRSGGSRRRGSRRSRPASITARSPRSATATRVEITTLRRDVSTDGRRATVAFTDDWQEDAARRDFTINALCPPIRTTGEMFDYFGGLDDLERAPHPLHRRPAAAHCRGPSADPALLPLPRPLRRRRARRRRARSLHRARQRPDGPVARADRRRAAEAARPARPGADGRRSCSSAAILKPVLPEIETAAVGSLHGLIAAEREAGDRSRRDSAGSRRCCRATPLSPRTSPPGSGCRTRRGSGWPAPPSAGLGHQPRGARLSRRDRMRGRPAAACRRARTSRVDSPTGGPPSCRSAAAR